MTRNQRRFVTTTVLLCLTWVSCARVPPAVTPTGPVVLALITWNMNAGRGDLPRLADDLWSGRLTGTPPGDAVLLLQESIEGAPHDVSPFAAARKLHAYFAPVRTSPGRVSGNAIVSSRPFVDARTIPLPRERQPRSAATATIEVAGERLFVASVHLENRLSWLQLGLFADRARGRQGRELIAALPRSHGIVGGDMNTILGPREDAWRILRMRFPDTPREQAEPTFRDRLVLDHLFFDLPDGWTAARRVAPDRYGSDHHPVIGLIRR